MLHLLQYASLIAAFLLPFVIGMTVQGVKSGERRKRIIGFAALAGDIILIALAVWLAFGISSVQ